MEGIKTETFSVPETAKVFGVSRGLIYVLVKRGELPSVRLGTKILIPRATVSEMLKAAPQKQPPVAEPAARKESV